MRKDPRALFEALEAADPIVVFHHISPDPDALGTQLGMVEFLKARYPHKTILAAGSQPGMDEISDEQIHNALALLVDTSDSERVDDQRFAQAKTIARIDHHIPVEDFGALDYVDETASAAAQYAALLLKEAGQTIPSASAQHFYEGLVSDSQKFSLGNVTPATFEAAAWLVEQGADLVLAQKHLYTRTQETFFYQKKVLEKSVLRGKLLFAVMSMDDYLSAGCPFEEAKSRVNVLASVEGVEIWALFTQNAETSLYNASLRSTSIPVQPLASRWGGGGHANACGIKNLSVTQVQKLIEELAELSLTPPDQKEEA